MPSVTLEVSALVIVLVERDAQPVVVEVDRPVQVLDFEEDLFDTNESHGLPPPSVQNGDLLEPLHARILRRGSCGPHYRPGERRSGARCGRSASCCTLAP